MAPADLTTDISGAQQASATTTIDFIEGDQLNTGFVGISDKFVIVKQGSADSIPYEVTAKGTALVKGTWTYDIDDDDDLLLDLDYSSIKVTLPVTSVSISGKGKTALTAAQTDSIKNYEADLCASQITLAMTKRLHRFSVISDIETSKDKSTLGFEIHSPETDLRFRNVAP